MQNKNLILSQPLKVSRFLDFEIIIIILVHIQNKSEKLDCAFKL